MAIAMPIHSRAMTRSPSSWPNRAAKTGLVATSATDAAVDVRPSDAIHTPKCAPSSRPDSASRTRSRPVSRRKAEPSVGAAITSSSAAAIATRSAATLSAGAGAAACTSGAAVEIARIASPSCKSVRRGSATPHPTTPACAVRG